MTTTEDINTTERTFAAEFAGRLQSLARIADGVQGPHATSTALLAAVIAHLRGQGLTDAAIVAHLRDVADAFAATTTEPPSSH